MQNICALLARSLQVPALGKLPDFVALQQKRQHQEFMMTKPNTFGKKPLSLRPDEDGLPDSSLYGHVTALNALQATAPHAPQAADSPAFTTGPHAPDDGGLPLAPVVLAAPARPGPDAITYPITSVSKVYQHWADGDTARGTQPEWNNNILSSGKSDYFEGEVVPHVYFYKASNNTPLVTGQTYSFNVTYNHYQANTNAGGFVYMTTPNTDRQPSSFAGGEAQVDSGFANGGGMQGAFYTVNADITAVSDVTYTGVVGSSRDGQVTINFIYTGPTTTSGGAEIQYGLLIAAPGDVADQGKGPTDGANAWTGGSLQTTVDIGGSGATSIQLAPSAIIVGEISGMKFSDVDGNGTRDADGADNLLNTADDEIGLANWKIFLDKDADGIWDEGEAFDMTDANGQYTLSVVPDADRLDPDNDPYIVREVNQTGWVQTTANPAPILITALDPTETNVNFGNMLQQPSLNIVKDASVEGGYADAAGDVIAYAISVANTGNQTLTGVTVTDPFIGNLVRIEDAATADGELDVGETWSYTASHVVTQAEIDAGTSIVNVATADSNQTDPDTDDASIPVDQNPELNIIKDATVAGGSANVAGEVIAYSISVQNTGNQTLTDVTVTDPFISDLVRVEDAATADNELDVGETWHYTASHVVTQAEIDAGTTIVNTATADSDQTGPNADDASIPVDQNPELNIVKDATVAGGSANVAGEVIAYAIAVQNTGNQTLTGVTVNDPFISDLTLVADAASADGELDVGETWHYTASHVVTQAEIDAGTPIVNTATADSNQTGPDTDDASVVVEQAPGLNIVKDASVAGGTANVAGEVIAYAIAVQNTGNQTLTGVTVNDPFISDLTLVADAASADGELDVGETWHYTASHVVTQAEIDAGSPIVNLATADSDQTDPDTDDASVPVQQDPDIALDKAIEIITQGNGNTTADAAGDVLNYTVTVFNRGNVTLTDVTITDVLTGLNIEGVTLEPGESRTYEASYVLTQQDLDTNGGGDGYIENTATADSAQTDAVSDMEHILVRPRASLGLNKVFVGVTDGNGNASVDAAGDVLHYTATVTNEGNVTLTGVSVMDPTTGLNETGLTLAPGESATYASTYTLTQIDVDSNGDGDGYHDNIAMADSDQTAPLTDAESTPLLRTIGLGVEKNVTSITGGNNNGFADQAGESINYTINVYNAGTVTLTNVTVVDELTGLSQTIDVLAPGDSQLYLTSYTLTQADLDDTSPGSGYIDNATLVDSDQTLPTFDNEMVQLIRSSVLYFDKAFLNVTGGNGNNLVDAAGDVLNYRIVVANPSNMTLTNVSITEPLTGLVVDGLSLAPGQIQTYLTSYTLTQEDIDNNGGGDGYIDNSAVADSAQTTAISDIESVPILRSIGMHFDKGLVNIDGGNGNTLADAAGDMLNYVFTVSNAGTVTLTNLTVVDDLTGMNEFLASLAPGASVTYHSSYMLTQADLDSNAGGDGVLINTATADTSETPVFSDAEGVTVVYQPIIDLTKYVSVDNGTTWVDANGPTGPLLSSGSGIDPQFKYTVSNSGNITLADVVLTDDVFDLNGAADGTAYSFGTLAVGETMAFIYTGATWAEGQQSGNAAVSVAGMPSVLDVDNAYYLGV
jgi:uncharacterized repeat protein (TIGR01451 family)